MGAHVRALAGRWLVGDGMSAMTCDGWSLTGDPTVTVIDWRPHRAIDWRPHRKWWTQKEIAGVCVGYMTAIQMTLKPDPRY